MEEDPDARIAALKALYSQKTKSLLQTITSLEGEIKRLKNASKEHKRSALIAGLQEMVHERDTVVEVLKVSLEAATGRTREAIDTFILKKTTGMPAKIRPRTREELGVEIESLHRKLDTANITIRKLELENLSAKRSAGAAGPAALMFPPIHDAVNASGATDAASRPSSGLDGARRDGKSMTSSEVSKLREQVAHLEAINAEQQDEIHEMQERMKGLMDIEASAGEMSKALTSSRSTVKQLEAQLLTVRSEAVISANKVQSMQTEMAVLQRQLAEVPSPRDMKPSASRVALEAAKGTLEAENAQVQQAMSGIQKDLATARTEISKLTAERNEALSHVQKEREQRKMAETSLVRLDARVEEHKRKIATLELELLGKQEELEMLMQQRSSRSPPGLSDRSIEATDTVVRAAVEAAVAEKDHEVKNLKATVDSLQLDVKREHSRRTDAEKERDNLRNRIEQDEMFSQEAQKRFESDLEAAMSACTESEARVKTLEAQIEGLKQKQTSPKLVRTNRNSQLALYLLIISLFSPPCRVSTRLKRSHKHKRKPQASRWNAIPTQT
jgi:DNA repair exonuclease SbcCD ATPase subunit